MEDTLAEIRNISGFDEKLFYSLHENARNVILKKPPNKCYIYDNMPAKIQCYFNNLDRDNIPGVLIYVFDMAESKIYKRFVDEYEVEEVLNLDQWRKYMEVSCAIEEDYVYGNARMCYTLKQFLGYEVVPYSIDAGWLQTSINLENSFSYMTKYFSCK